MIPCFVMAAIYYGDSVQRGAPIPWERWFAIGIFILASLSDALDGFLARRLNQKSRIGAILDPLADKGLLVAAILVLSFSGWDNAFPLWYPILVIGRDIFILLGVGVLHVFVGHVEISPSFIGKLSTALQMVAIAWIMLLLPHPEPVVIASGAATALSGIEYFRRGLHLMHSHEQSRHQP